jgi:hypothetical protein
MSAPELTFVFEIRAEVTGPLHVGRGPDEVLEVYPSRGDVTDIVIGVYTVG